jgi:methylthioribose-1-phosphate isomerase
MAFETLAWKEPAVADETAALVLLDQTRLPREVVFLECRDVETVADSIERLVVRGAPAIGVAAAYGVALGARLAVSEEPQLFRQSIDQTIERLARTRPTAVNLFWALGQMRQLLDESPAADNESLCDLLLTAAHRICAQDNEICRRLGQHGAALLSDGDKVLTHCNAGGLATAGYGTALGVIYAAAEADKKLKVFADETRPLLQGSRLTAWELMQNGIDVTLICDNMAASVMRSERLDCVIVGADRIASNGDVANKIGTYGVAVLARQHDIPFYVAAPMSTIDMELSSGEQIPIEERAAEEVSFGFDCQTAPHGVDVYNPAFDVTPHELVSAIVTEFGIARPPFNDILRTWADAALASEPVNG